MSAAPQHLAIADSQELASDCAQTCKAIGIALKCEVSASPLVVARDRLLSATGPIHVAVTAEPSLAAVVELGAASRQRAMQVAFTALGSTAGSRHALGVASDLGLVATSDVRAFASSIAELATTPEPWRASLEALPRADAEQLAHAFSPAESSAKTSHGRLVRDAHGSIAWEHQGRSVVLGMARDVAAACLAHRAAMGPLAGLDAALTVQGVDAQAVIDVVFGPPRRLSDPASKAAVRPYGVPIPIEELCATPSRAAAEATRIGFPVRIALASPDLRLWDHPGLAIDGVESAAQVRDAFRQLTGMGASISASARILGVTVTDTVDADALLSVQLTPAPAGLVLARIGFADAHGTASGDETYAVLPAPTDRVRHAIGRLRGAALVARALATADGAFSPPLVDVLARLAAFTHERRAEVEAVEIRPLAILRDGGVEVREACVVVGDAFVRGLSAPLARKSA